MYSYVCAYTSARVNKSIEVALRVLTQHRDIRTMGAVHVYHSAITVAYMAAIASRMVETRFPDCIHKASFTSDPVLSAMKISGCDFQSSILPSFPLYKVGHLTVTFPHVVISNSTTCAQLFDAVANKVIDVFVWNVDGLAACFARVTRLLTNLDELMIYRSASRTSRCR
jgi:hypothetical protein